MTDRSRIDAANGSRIAICGMAGRFPGAPDIDAFWNNLRDGVESITHFSEEALLAAGVDPATLKDPSFVPARPILEGVELFDADFFGFTPREAEILDPQQRLFLECAWEAMEHAGYDPERCRGAISVFAGTSMSSYLFQNVFRNLPVLRSFGQFESALCNVQDSLATRVAYKLNLRGPCYTLQAFCSTSLVAVHVACQSLLNYECDLALAGGVTVGIPQKTGYMYQAGGILSSDGRCRSFDRSANGTVFGNGLGLVVLQRLQDALDDGATIHAVILGSAANNDGSLKVSYAAPSVVGQAEVVVEALAAAGVDAESISYIEAHGTATALGDPAEVASLTKAFRTQTERSGFCAIGSVKSNVGHLDAAAGVTGLIKTVLALKHKWLPPSLHYESANPQISFAGSPFYVNTKLAPWETNGCPRRAGVSAFGVGGTNAHVILEEPAADGPADGAHAPYLLVLSAKSAAALDQATARLAVYLRQHPEANLVDVAYTLQVGRQAFGHRRMVVCESIDDAVLALEAADPSRVISALQEHQDPPLGFVFPGSISRSVNVGKDLYERQEVFRSAVEECCTIFQPFVGIDLRPLLFPPTGEAVTRANSSEVAGPAVFVLEYALAKLWLSWGVRPAVMLGDGIGELVAACVAGVFPLEDAVRLAAHRGRPNLGIRSVHPAAPRIPLISCTDGSQLTAEQATNPDHWLRQPAKPGGITKELQTLISGSRRLALRMGPGDPLVPADGAHPTTESQSMMPSLDDSGDVGRDLTTALTAVGRLWLAGVEIDWSGLYGSQRRRRVPLPTYPFQRQRFWVEPLRTSKEPAALSSAPVKNPEVARWFYHPVWKTSVPPLASPVQYDAGCYLLFLDESGLGLRIAEGLRHAGCTVRTVRSGPAFRGDPQGSYTIDSGRGEDYGALIGDLVAQGQVPSTIVHLWTVDAIDGDGAFERFEAGSGRGFYSILLLTQALSEHGLTKPLHVKVVSTQLHETIGGEVVCPEKAALLSLCKVIPQEHPNIRCCSIDVMPLGSGQGKETDSLGRLIQDLQSPSAGEEVAYRGGRRWVRTYEAIPIDRLAGPVTCLREGGVYLIIGGMGEIGNVFAKYLAKSVRATLILTASTKLPPRQEWDQWVVGHPRPDRTGRRIANVRALEALGATVFVAQADVADGGRMQAVVDEAERRFGPIHGVIHAAGVVGGSSFRPVRELTRTECDEQFAAKVRGLWVLDRLFAGKRLDFCLLTSSLSSVLGGLGYAAYAAANVFLDAFAHSKNQDGGTPWISVNWDQWRFAEEDADANKSALAKLAITPEEGDMAFEKIVHSRGLSQIVISTASLQSRLAMWVQLDDAGGEHPTKDEASAQYPRPAALEETYAAPSTEMERVLADVWQEALGMDRVGVHDNFFDLGGHSLLTIQVIAKIEEQTGVRVRIEDFLSQTLGQIAAASEEGEKADAAHGRVRKA